MLSSVVAGVTLGLSVALPFGPVSLICVQRSITDGIRHGLVAGVGAASAHGIFATAALLGQDAVSDQLIRWSEPIRWISAALLLWLGIRTIARHNRPREQAPPAGMPTTYGSSLALALSNPMTVLPYLALATGAAAGSGTGQLFSSWSVPGVITGAITWYAILSIAASAFRPGAVRGLVRPLNLIAGCILVVFSIRVGVG